MRACLFGLVLSALIAAPALACGPVVKGATSGPPIAALLDEALPKAQLTDADLAKVRELRAQIATLTAAQQIAEARAVEADAMRILGYKRLPSRCGTFAWMKIG